MTISIIHPSRSRPEMAYKTFLEWMGNSHTPDNIEYILSIDSSDPLINQYYDLFEYTYCFIRENDNKSAIEAINNGAKLATGDLLVVVSDDFSSFYGWDTALTDMLVGRSDFIVKTQDGIQKTIITLPILDRVYYNRFGYIYMPGYKHMFCDTEMTAVAEMTGKVITLPMIFKHNHYIVGGMKKDALNDRNDKTWGQGEKLFNERKAINFGLKDEEIVKPYSDIKWR